MRPRSQFGANWLFRLKSAATPSGVMRPRSQFGVDLAANNEEAEILCSARSQIQMLIRAAGPYDTTLHSTTSMPTSLEPPPASSSEGYPDAEQTKPITTVL